MPIETETASQLHQVLERARRTSFYEGRNLPVSAKQWEQIPLTTKEDLRKSYPFGLLGVPLSQLATYHESSGTSGKPISSYFTDNDWQDVQSRFLRGRAQLTNEDMVLVKTPYSLVTTALQMHGAARLAGATVVPADNRSGNMPYARAIRLLHELPITVTWSLPTEALIWAYLIRCRGLNPAIDFPHLRALVVAGETLSPAKKRFLERIWGGKSIVEDYGSTETGSLAGECELGQLHVWSDRILFETCDDTGATIESEGSLVVTPLFREAMPLVRYDMEDFVHLSHTCACGSPHPAIEVLGRRQQKMLGRIFPKQLEECIYADGGDPWFWRARIRDDGLEIEIHGDGISTATLEKNLWEVLRVKARIELVSAAQFVFEDWFAIEQTMQKPRFVFQENEDWSRSLAYGGSQS